ncbi:MAG: prepilin-type N-terminal cleavage/methylation domain-containing protein [Pyramidobacter sp.]|nr:prepilin-type N-terminal cleavage/methylation domain-containing protein [Pyramidobacter sp.]
MNRHCYTLVELMVVIAISALLLSLGMPAFRGMIEGDGAGYTASAVKGVIDQTRSKGLSLRRYTAILFDLEADRENALQRQAVRGCILEKDDDDKFTFREWIPDRQWLVLDRGGWVLGADDKAKIEADASSGLELEDIITNDLKDMMTEIEVKKDDDGEAEENHKYYGIVFSPYGAMVKPSKRIYILVGEAKMRGDRLRYTRSIDDDDKVPLNALVLSVNPFTGRVETKGYEK